MSALPRTRFLAALLGITCVCAPAVGGVQQDADLLAIPSELRHLNFVWAKAKGDLNGDAIPDLALVLTGSNGEGSREERLVVLVGEANGRYKLLSVSDELCRPSKFYNLEIQNNSVFVQAVEYADAARFSAFTLQFRYSAARQDLELIGEKADEEDYDDNSFYKISINYLTKIATHTRHAGKRHKEAKVRLTISSALLPLQAFACGNHGLPESPIFIGEDFRVHQQQKSSR